MGNPHGVIFLDEPVEMFELTKYGPALENHPAFPKKVNIEFVNVLSSDRLRMRVWERGQRRDAGLRAQAPARRWLRRACAG